MTSDSKTLPIHIPLTGLLDIAFDAMIAEFRAELAKSEFSDIRPTHGCVFRYVKGPGLRLTEIAERGNMTKQSAGEIVDDLEARGYVKRVPDPADRRAKLICLTERGEEAQAYGFRIFAEVEERWAERFGAERIAALRETLEEIAAVEAPFAVPELAHAEPAGV
ncbi:MAG TPA: MarR family winged helix-turn-helix transcriptional regulator [Solirubrobacterales bacterium]|nr:MarR family winged helix-turn-helix transcriptional regulator [Solirubrobacterales bacterium]